MYKCSKLVLQVVIFCCVLNASYMCCAKGKESKAEKLLSDIEKYIEIGESASIETSLELGKSIISQIETLSRS